MLAEDVTYCPRCGTKLESLKRHGALRPVCPNCDWIFFADPKVAAGVVVLRDRKILLVRRAITPRRGLWTLPVGFVDAGENPGLAAARECLEETGLEIKITGLLDVFSGQEHPRGAHILIVYNGEICGGSLRPGDDASEVGFFSKEEIPPLAFSSAREIIDRSL
jgi:ADP-ribose pyrophosphatase YjhB (NUDIX family)